MNVHQVVPHQQPGGVREVVLLLDEGLAARGWSTSIVDLQRESPRSGRLAKRLGFGHVQLAARLWKRWRARQADVVMAHTVWAGALSLTVALLSGVRQRVQVVHGNRSHVGSAKAMCVKVMSYLGITTGVVFVGHSAARSYGSFSQRPEVAIIQNGVTFTATHDLRAANANESLRAVFAGRLSPEKGPMTAIDACLLAEASMHLVVCGDGPLRGELESHAARSSRVSFVGMLDRESLHAALIDADIFLFPSTHEGLPLVLIEAAQSGLAVVALDTDFNHEVLGPDAVYLPTSSPAAWAAELDRLDRDRDRIAVLAQGSLRRGADFSPERMVDAYVNLLRD